MLALIIATRNRPILLRELFKALNNLNLKPSLIVLVDSSDLEEDYSDLTEIPLIYRHTEIKSAAIQRNIGLETLSDEYEFVAFLDDDTIPEENYFTKLLETMEKTKAIGISGIALDKKGCFPRKFEYQSLNPIRYLLFLDSRKEGWVTKGSFNIPIRQKYPGPVEVGWLIGCSLWKLPAIKSLKFNDNFFGHSLGEDVLFSVAANHFGKLIVDTSVVLHHSESEIGRESNFHDEISLMKFRLTYTLYMKKSSYWFGFLIGTLGRLLFLFAGAIKYRRKYIPRILGLILSPAFLVLRIK